MTPSLTVTRGSFPPTPATVRKVDYPETTARSDLRLRTRLRCDRGPRNVVRHFQGEVDRTYPIMVVEASYEPYRFWRERNYSSTRIDGLTRDAWHADKNPPRSDGNGAIAFIGTPISDVLFGHFDGYFGHIMLPPVADCSTRRRFPSRLYRHRQHPGCARAAVPERPPSAR